MTYSSIDAFFKVAILDKQTSYEVQGYVHRSSFGGARKGFVYEGVDDPLLITGRTVRGTVHAGTQICSFDIHFRHETFLIRADENIRHRSLVS